MRLQGRMDAPGSSQEEQADPELWVLCSLCWGRDLVSLAALALA